MDSAEIVSSGKAYGKDRDYQVVCRDALIFRDSTLVPWQEEGIDVRFKLPDTTWRFDVALRSASRSLLVAECRRTAAAVKQEAVAAFAYKVNQLRKTLGIQVDAVFVAKTSVQLGAVRVGRSSKITLAVLGEDSSPPGFNITFFRYDPEREVKLRDFIVHVPTGHYKFAGHSATLTHGKESDGSGSKHSSTNVRP